MSNTLEILERAARLGGRTAQSVRDLGLSPEFKSVKGFTELVTKGDAESQRVIVEYLNINLPGVAVVAEEQRDPSISTSNFITLDPIDGTLRYCFSSKVWGVLISLIDGGQVQTAAAYQPDLEIMVSAARGRGCTLNGRKIVFGTRGAILSESIVCADVGPWLSNETSRSAVSLIASGSRGILSTLAAIESFRSLLSGEVDAYVTLSGASIWDLAAGALAVEEAGGIGVDLQGNSLRWDALNMKAVFATNRNLAQEIVNLLNRPAKC